MPELRLVLLDVLLVDDRLPDDLQQRADPERLELEGVRHALAVRRPLLMFDTFITRLPALVREFQFS